MKMRPHLEEVLLMRENMSLKREKAYSRQVLQEKTGEYPERTLKRKKEGETASETDNKKINDTEIKDNYSRSVDGGTNPEVTKGICGDNINWNLSNGILTLEGTGEMFDGPLWEGYDIDYVIIPEGITYIGDYAFSSLEIVSITLPNTVLSIGRWAFSNCGSLQSVSLSNQITEISEYCFYGCKNLEIIEIPDSVTFIAERAFSYCTGLNTIDLPESIDRIGPSAFENCKSLESIIFPNSIKIINFRAFWDCTGLTSIEVPKDLTLLAGNEIFYNTILSSVYFRGTSDEFVESNISTESLRISNSVIDIPDVYVLNSDNEYYLLKSVTISDGVTEIPPNKFSGYTQLESIEFPLSLKGIERSAFSDCEGLSYVEVPEGVESIGYCAFNGCSNLKRAILPSTLNSIGEDAFSYSDVVLVVYENSYAHNYALENEIPYEINTEEIEAESIALSEHEITIDKGSNLTLSATIYPEATTNKNLIWSSSDSNVVFVSKSGVVLGVNEGTATVTVSTANGKTDSCEVIVEEKTPPVITLEDVVSTAYNKLKLTWTKCEGADGYLVYRKSESEDYSIAKSIANPDTTELINAVTSGVKYTYRVSAYKQNGTKKTVIAESNEQSAIALPASPAMKSVGMAAFNKIKVIWTKVSGCAGYVIYRSAEEDGQYSVLKTVTMATATEYSNIIQDGQTYYYKIRAFVEVNGKKIYGDYSEIVSGDVIDAPPANFCLEQRTATKIIFNWDKVEDCEGYVIYRYFPDTGKCKAIKNITSNDILTYSYKVEADTDYQFTMRAYRVMNGKKVYSDYTNIIKTERCYYMK